MIWVTIADMSIVVSLMVAQICALYHCYIYKKKEMALIHLFFKFCCSVLPLAESMSPPQWFVGY